MLCSIALLLSERFSEGRIQLLEGFQISKKMYALQTSQFRLQKVVLRRICSAIECSEDACILWAHYLMVLSEGNGLV